LAGTRGLSKAQIAQRVGCCRQTVYIVLARARGLPEGQAPVPGKPGPPAGTGVRTPPRSQAPGHLQLDVKYLPGKRYEYTALDVYSRFVFARVASRLDSHTAA
jgi:hypothetical protein